MPDAPVPPQPIPYLTFQKNNAPAPVGMCSASTPSPPLPFSPAMVTEHVCGKWLATYACKQKALTSL